MTPHYALGYSLLERDVVMASHTTPTTTKHDFIPVIPISVAIFPIKSFATLFTLFCICVSHYSISIPSGSS